MDRQIPESDWKKWRKLSAEALQRYCAKVLAKAATFADGEAAPHDRYLALWKYMKKTDAKIGNAFDNPRRSQAFLQIAAAVSAGVVTRAELGVFSDETQAVISLLIDGW